MTLSVMLDMETLATTADAVILSIGAVRFDTEGRELLPDPFYSSITIESNLDHGRRISESTLQWWMQQSVGAQTVFHEKKCYLSESLVSFRTWFEDGGKADKTLIWSNGAAFDIPMLEHAYLGVLGIAPPWKFWNARCFRTLKNEYPSVTAPVNALAHNALQDAIAQASYLQAIYAEKNK